MSQPYPTDLYSERTRRLLELVRRRIVVFDGAMGTQLQNRQLKEDDFGGAAYEGCNENLNLQLPHVVREIHGAFLDAGADIIETNTFGVMPIVLEEYGLADAARELAAAGARLAREAADAHSSAERPRFVAGALGPTTRSLSVTGGATFEQLHDSYAEAIRGLLDGGVDVLLFETSLDSLNLKAGTVAARTVFAERKTALPMMLSVTIEQMGTMLAGQDIEAALVSFQHLPLLSFGLNCSTGPEFMTDHLRTLSRVSPFATSVIPNAGLPDAEGHYNLSPQDFAAALRSFAREGWVNIVGGCCGTGPEHIRLVAEAVADLPPRQAQPVKRAVVSGMEALELAPENGPYMVGERTNSLGSRKFKRLIAEGKLDEAAEIGRKQVRAGAHVLDVCLQNPDRDEASDMAAFLDVLLRRVKVPLMIDTTDVNVLEAACRRIQGKIIYNSVNLEDGEERFARVTPVARTYGMALIVGCIDDDKQHGMAVTRRRKLEVARRSHELLTGKYGIPETDLIFDPLVFPCGTGDQNYVGSARETIEGVRLIKQAFPNCRTTLGISNVSFGLPPAGREVLNSVFLHLCLEAGLDLPIVNAQKVVRYAQISDEDKQLCMDLIDNVGDDPIAAFAAHFRRRKVAETAIEDRRKLPVEERLKQGIVDGSKEGLHEDLDELLARMRPLQIINGPLMAGMDEVGRLFGRNDLIVAEVLQSAEVMKAAVAYLEPHMDKADSAARGRLLLATVKGDVHDIGKGLVKIILGNNGFDVVDLGIKVPPEKLVEACRKHQPDLIGLSGLLVKSAMQMVTTVEDLHRAGVDVPVLVGGAALSDRFTRTRIAPAYGGAPAIYARDAMNGLDLANQVIDPARRERLWAERREAPDEQPAPAASSVAAPKPEAIDHAAVTPPRPPDLKLHVLQEYDLDEILRYVNPMMLYGRHLGFKGNLERALERGDQTAARLHADVARVIDEMHRKGLGRPQAIYRFFPATGEGDTLTLYRSLPSAGDGDPAAPENVAAQFTFPRQSNDKLWSVADFARRYDPATRQTDFVALFVTTCGHGVRQQADDWIAEGRFFDAHALQALALECAEGFAELLHAKLRAMWGFPDTEALTMRELFQARYRGVRLSFGYPACPRLEDQALLFETLEVSRHLPVRLTEGCMMDPEASVSAVVFHHPQARYFSINSDDLARFEASLTRASAD